MTFSYPKVGRTEKTDRTVQFLNDLVKINNDRIAGYEKALEQPFNVDASLRLEFVEIISEAKRNREQLVQKISELNGNAKSGTSMFGKIYRAWTDLKVTFAYSTQKMVVNSCLYNEEIALHAYRAALNMNLLLDDDIREMVEAQEDILRKTHSRIKSYRESRIAADFSLKYFN